jgi:hypothetical protein
VQELKDAWQQLSARPAARVAPLPAIDPVPVAGTRAGLSFGVA